MTKPWAINISARSVQSRTPSDSPKLRLAKSSATLASLSLPIPLVRLASFHARDVLILTVSALRATKDPKCLTCSTRSVSICALSAMYLCWAFVTSASRRALLARVALRTVTHVMGRTVLNSCTSSVATPTALVALAQTVRRERASLVIWAATFATSKTRLSASSAPLLLLPTRVVASTSAPKAGTSTTRPAMAALAAPGSSATLALCSSHS